MSYNYLLTEEGFKTIGTFNRFKLFCRVSRVISEGKFKDGGNYAIISCYTFNPYRIKMGEVHLYFYDRLAKKAVKDLHPGVYILAEGFISTTRFKRIITNVLYVQKYRKSKKLGEEKFKRDKFYSFKNKSEILEKTNKMIEEEDI